MYKFTLFIAISLQTILLYAQENNQFKKVFLQISGNFNTYNQRKKLSDTVASVFHPHKPWLNTLYAWHIPVSIPALGKHIIYLEWRDEKGNISRQRLWHFKQGNDQQIKMDFYAFKVDSLFKDIKNNLSKLQQITLNDLVSYPDGCTLIFTKQSNKFIGLLNPTTCKVITQRSNRIMQLFASIQITKKGFYYSEYGQLPDGSLAFKVPGFERYWFQKQVD
jgi:CpeT/CpcT family (DUF1001)